MPVQLTCDIHHKMILLKCLLLLLTVSSTFGQMVRTMVYTKLNYTVDTKYWNLTMWLNGTSFNVFNVAGLITTGLTLDTKLYVNTDGSNGAYALFVTKHMNVCEFLDNPMSDPLVHLIIQPIYMNKNNHVMRKCPIIIVSYMSNSFVKICMVWVDCFAV